MSATCLGHLGKLDEADASLKELLHAKPDFSQSGRTLIGYFVKSNELRERIFDGLGKAGLPLAVNKDERISAVVPATPI
jgi:hypothetical protein